MTRLVAPITIAAAAVGGTNETMQLLEKQTIGLPAAAAITICVVGIVLWMDRQFSKRDAKQAQRFQTMAVWMTRVEDRLANLQCIKEKCPLPPPPSVEPEDESTT